MFWQIIIIGLWSGLENAPASFREISGPSGPKLQKTKDIVSPGLPARSQKTSEKSQKRVKKESKEGHLDSFVTLFSPLSRFLFRTICCPRAGRRRETFFCSFFREFGTALASYRLEKKLRNPETRKANRQKIGTFDEKQPSITIFSLFFCLCYSFSLLDFGVFFLFCSWPTQSPSLRARRGAERPCGSSGRSPPYYTSSSPRTTPRSASFRSQKGLTKPKTKARKTQKKRHK